MNITKLLIHIALLLTFASALNLDNDQKRVLFEGVACLPIGYDVERDVSETVSGHIPSEIKERLRNCAKGIAIPGYRRISTQLLYDANSDTVQSEEFSKLKCFIKNKKRKRGFCFSDKVVVSFKVKDIKRGQHVLKLSGHFCSGASESPPPKSDRGDSPKVQVLMSTLSDDSERPDKLACENWISERKRGIDAQHEQTRGKQSEPDKEVTVKRNVNVFYNPENDEVYYGKGKVNKCYFKESFCILKDSYVFLDDDASRTIQECKNDKKRHFSDVKLCYPEKKIGSYQLQAPPDCSEFEIKGSVPFKSDVYSPKSKIKAVDAWACQIEKTYYYDSEDIVWQKSTRKGATEKTAPDSETCGK